MSQTRVTMQDPARQVELGRDGFTAAPLLDAQEVATLRAAYDEHGPAPGDQRVACYFDFQSDDLTYKTATDDAIVEVVRPHLGDLLVDHVDHYSSFIQKWPGARSGFGPHQDKTAVDEATFTSVTVWCALDDATMTNGAVWFVPGSHRVVPFARGAYPKSLPLELELEAMVAEFGVGVPLRAGEALIFDHRVVHYSFPNHSNRPRLAAATLALPAETGPLHVHDHGDGLMEAFAVDREFFLRSTPFTLGDVPTTVPSVARWTQAVPAVTWDGIVECCGSDDARTAKLADGSWVRDGSGDLSINPDPFCFRCGTDEGLGEHGTTEWGNVVVLCDDCSPAATAAAG